MKISWCGLSELAAILEMPLKACWPPGYPLIRIGLPSVRWQAGFGAGASSGPIIAARLGLRDCLRSVRAGQPSPHLPGEPISSRETRTMNSTERFASTFPKRPGSAGTR